MNRHDLFRYRNDMNYLKNKSEDIEAEREKLYHTTPVYEEKYGGSFGDRLSDGVIRLIEKEEYYSKEMKELAHRLHEVEKAVGEMKTTLYRNILYLKYLSPYPWTIHEIWEQDKLGKHYSDEKYVSDLHRRALDEFDE